MLRACAERSCAPKPPKEHLKCVSFAVILKGLGPVAPDTSSGLCAFTSLCGKQFWGELCLPGGVGLSWQLRSTPATQSPEPRMLPVGGHNQSAPTSRSQTLWLVLEGLAAGTVIAGSLDFCCGITDSPREAHNYDHLHGNVVRHESFSSLSLCVSVSVSLTHTLTNASTNQQTGK